MRKLRIGKEIEVTYYKVVAKVDGGEPETLCVKCIQTIPSKNEMLLFLNHIWIYGDNYTEIIEMKVIGEDEIKNYNVIEDVFVDNFFEIKAVDNNGVVHDFCIIGVNKPTFIDALNFINYNKTDCEKMENILSCHKIDINKVFTHYSMEGWSWPWDIE